jgi:hypothetical protein
VTYSSYFNSVLFPAVALTRFAQKLVPALSRDETGNLKETAAPLNLALTALFGGEKHLLKRASLPFGVSLIAVAQRA